MRYLRLFATLLASAWLAVCARTCDRLQFSRPCAPLAVGDEVRLNLLILNPWDDVMVAEAIEGRLGVFWK